MLQTVNGKQIAERFESLRRFSTADLNEHGGWILQRMLKVYPHLHEHTIAGYLRSMVDSNEHLFLYQPNSVALVQLDRGFTLEPESVVRERYVLARDPDNPEHVKEAAQFYTHIREWARHLGVRIVVLGEMSDVPLAVISKNLGKPFDKRLMFVRLT
jgi:hypothetical protein